MDFVRCLVSCGAAQEFYIMHIMAIMWRLKDVNSMSDVIIAAIISGTLGIVGTKIISKASKKASPNEEKRDENDLIKVSKEPCMYIEKIKQAKKCVCFCGVSIGEITTISVQGALSELSSQVLIDLVAGSLKHKEKIVTGLSGLLKPTEGYYEEAYSRLKRTERIIQEKRTVNR